MSTFGDPQWITTYLELYFLLYVAFNLVMEYTKYCPPQRAIMFYYNAPSCAELGTCPPGFHYYPDFATETQFEYDDVAAWNNKEYSCSLRWTPLVPSFLGLNSFLTIPSEDAARTLNSYDNVKSHIEVCSSLTGRDTNFYIADFWSVGDIPQVTQEHNLIQTSVRNRQRRRLGGGD